MQPSPIDTLDIRLRSRSRRDSSPRLPIEHLWTTEQEESRRIALASFDECQRIAYAEMLAIGMEQALMVRMYFEPEPRPYVRMCLAYGLPWQVFCHRKAARYRGILDSVLSYLRADFPLSGPALRAAQYHAKPYRKHIDGWRSTIDPERRHRDAIEYGVSAMPVGLPGHQIIRFKIVAEAKRDGRLDHLLSQEKTRPAALSMVLMFGLLDDHPSTYRPPHEVASRLGTTTAEINRRWPVFCGYLDRLEQRAGQ